MLDEAAAAAAACPYAAPIGLGAIASRLGCPRADTLVMEISKSSFRILLALFGTNDPCPWFGDVVEGYIDAVSDVADPYGI